MHRDGKFLGKTSLPRQFPPFANTKVPPHTHNWFMLLFFWVQEVLWWAARLGKIRAKTGQSPISWVAHPKFPDLRSAYHSRRHSWLSHQIITAKVWYHCSLRSINWETWWWVGENHFYVGCKMVDSSPLNNHCFCMVTRKKIFCFVCLFLVWGTDRHSFRKGGLQTGSTKEVDKFPMGWPSILTAS